MKTNPLYYQNIQNPSPAEHQYAEPVPKSSKNTSIKLVRDKLKNRRPSSGAQSKKNSVTGMSIELQKSRMVIGSPIISKHEKDSSSRKGSTGYTSISKAGGKSIKMKKSSIKTASGKTSKYNSIIGSRSRMQSSQVSEHSTHTRKKLAKEKIIDYVAQFIRTKHYNSETEAMSDAGYEDMIGNLKEFLQYLEDKNIINPKQLEDEKEINNLISDILKLDLTKFKGDQNEAIANSKRRSGSQNNEKDKTDMADSHFHKRSGSERGPKSKKLKDTRNSDTPNAEGLVSNRIKLSAEDSRRTNLIDHAQSQQQSSRRMNPSLEERKSTTSSINSNAFPVSGHRRANPSLEKKSSKNSSIQDNSVKASHRSSHKHHNSQTSEMVPIIEGEQKSTKESTNIISTVDMTNNSSIHLNEAIVTEREKLINFIKIYTKKHNAVPPTTLDLYKFVKLIGKGAFGKVTLGLHKLTGKHVAIKTFEKSYMKDDFSRKKVFQEVYILKKIHHSNIIRLLEVFESSKHFFIVMEYAGAGDLLHYVKKKRRLPENEARFIFKQILYGLGHCHCRSVLHRDIKLDNVLLDNEKGIKLCDFGVSKIIKKHQFIREQCGTPAYIAPEIIADEGYEGFFADLWSLGVVLYAML